MRGHLVPAAPGWAVVRCNAGRAATLLILTDGSPPTAVGTDQSGSISIVGSARLDTSIKSSYARNVGLRSNLNGVAHSYKKHGLDFLSRLEGDFGFVLWDETERRLILATDRFATRPIYYRLIPHGVVFSDAAVLAAGSQKPVITKRDVAEYLLGRTGRVDTTGYPDVKRLDAASVLSWSPHAHDVRKYWSLEIRDPPEGNIEEQFRDLFLNAVRRRIQSGQTASLLSGGLDSTSISIAASQLTRSEGSPPLPTISLVYPDFPEVDESQYIDAAIARGGMSPTKLTLPNHDPLEGVADTQRGLGGLFIGAGQMKIRKLYRVATERGCNIILDGHGGDEVVSYGLEFIVQLARQGRWARLLPLAWTYSQLWGDDLGSILSQLSRVAPRTLPNRLTRRALRAVARPHTRSGVDMRIYLNSEFLARSGVEENETSENVWEVEVDDYARSVHRNGILSKRNSRAFEALTWMARQEGVEARYPFFDRALVEFCVSLQGDQKIRFGETRSILRRGLSDLLPAEVRRRRDKAEFQGEVAAGLAMHHADRLDAIRRGVPGLAQFLAQPAVAAASENVARLGRNAAPSDAAITWRVATLAILLEENANAFDIRF